MGVAAIKSGNQVAFHTVYPECIGYVSAVLRNVEKAVRMDRP